MEWGEIVEDCPWRIVLDDGLARCKPVGDPCTGKTCAPMHLAAIWMYFESKRASLELMERLTELYGPQDNENKQ